MVALSTSIYRHQDAYLALQAHVDRGLCQISKIMILS